MAKQDFDLVVELNNLKSGTETFLVLRSYPYRVNRQINKRSLLTSLTITW